MLSIGLFIASLSLCPEKNTICATPDGGNVIMTVTTEDDAECGGERAVL